MSDRATKLLRVIVNSASTDGERLNAAAMLAKCFDSESIRIENIQWTPVVTTFRYNPYANYTPPPPRPKPPPPEPKIQRRRMMPFGKHKGKKMEDIPSDYLIWIVSEMNEPKPWILMTATAILVERGEFPDLT